MKTPAKRVTVDGKDAEPKGDNHWVVHFSKETAAAEVVVYTVKGDVIVSYLTKFSGVVYGGVIPGGGNFGGNSGGNSDGDSNGNSNGDSGNNNDNPQKDLSDRKGPKKCL